MVFNEKFQLGFKALETQSEEQRDIIARLQEELIFARHLAAQNSKRRAEWESLILRAIAGFKDDVNKGQTAAAAVARAEALLMPIGQVAKTYTIHCVGHAHIDMNWMWGWPETVAVVNDTFSTVDRLMDEFPDFYFSQSQASVYQILKDYLPELETRVKQRVQEGRWEVAACHWVEGDKNLASGESICRHLLYTRNFFLREYGLPYDAVKIDWDPDTFGHALSIPTILNQAGIRWYYLHRSAHGPKLFWWQSQDGARVLVFDDCSRGYNGVINPAITRGLLEFEQATGLKDFLFVYGVGDHGGGPTRQSLKTAQKMNAWPIFPNVKLSTVAAFFSLAEQQSRDLPLIIHELNYVHEGCYTSQSGIKYANRRSENALVEAEACALLGGSLAGLPYPTDDLYHAWRNTLFNQFHDILPGSCVRATREYSAGLFQEIMARTSMIKTRALRGIVDKINTAAITVAAAAPAACSSDGSAMTAGHGDLAMDGTVSRLGPGGDGHIAFAVFNPNPWQRSEVITTRIWDRPAAENTYMVYDDSGQACSAQLIERGGYWGHNFTELTFPVSQVPALGYRTYRIVPTAELPTVAETCAVPCSEYLENEFFKLEVEPASGAIIHLIDKASGIDFVPTGSRLGLLEYILEAPHGMSSWMLGQPIKTTALLEGGSIECPFNGPYRKAIRVHHKINDSVIKLTIGLSAGVSRIDFQLEVNWLERGSPESGVPALKIAFPLALTNGIARFESPNSNIARSVRKSDISTHTTRWSNCYAVVPQGLDFNPAEVPAQKWADLTGQLQGAKTSIGATLLNDSKYGHSIIDNTIRLSLLRSSYEPDLLPELGQHVIRFALQPHVGEWTVSAATRAGYAFNMPLNVVAASVHPGSLAAQERFMELLTPNVMLSGFKKAEDSDALIVRLYEMEGRDTMAQLWLSEHLITAKAPVVITDIMEQPQQSASKAYMEKNVLHVKLPAFGLVTVKIG